ncbi:MAG TPA: ABC transporter ATP-binding protein, partial [Verrucomicrobiales bacterium]|nr:ABC transporter ATP-binding protein [Verrucomicrobiales bacterium]
KVETWEMAEILKSSVELRGVTKWYESDPERRILDGLDLVVNGGERFAIVGPSGCGKSTLLNLLGTLDVPSEGKVIIDGIDTSGLSEEEIAKIRSEKIGFIFQMHHLLPQCTALENVLIPTLALATRPDPRISADWAKELFSRVGLADKGNRHPGQLSGGERQRVAVVRALINRPRLLLADEPTGALDEDNAARLIELLVELNRTEDLAMIVVTHDRTVAESVGAIRTLNRGKLESHS